MKRFLMGAAIAALLCTPVEASKDLFRKGFWTVFYGNSTKGGQEICGMRLEFDSGRTVYIKAFANDPGLTFHLMQSTWNFPTEGVAVPLEIGVDRNGMFQGDAFGYVNEDTRERLKIIQAILNAEQGERFLQEFGNANVLWIKFHAGNEPMMVMDMRGSREVLARFRQCRSYIDNRTQPYAAPNHTQPFDNKPKTVPTQPTDGSGNTKRPPPVFKKGQGEI